jgi:molecular chaperone DnaK
LSNTINFGIDLGTSNSLLAKFDKGHVEVLKNPSGFKESLPSVVGFRNDRVLIGDSARSYLVRDAKSVVSRFKRKMGTAESFQIKSLDNASKTPVELSAYVLKELKTFVQSGEELDSAVITIPASFDTLQSNATKEAGKLAGFKNVVLLQEPIAASLAYANKERNIDLKNSQWLVYDLGGGTFDAALVRIVEGELTVVDHEGDNYLGGTDFDAAIVESLVVPALQKLGKFDDLLNQMKSQSGRYNQLWYTLLLKAEDAKVELSAKTSAEIDLGTITVEDDDGRTIDSIITITRSDFEGLIRDQVDGTAEMVKRILTRNSLQPSDLKFVLMVGGSTYIPFVRKRVQEVMGIPVNTSIDPTNAIAAGAAYFAGTKEKTFSEGKPKSSTSPLKIRTAYNKTSQESEEAFTAKVEGDLDGLSYRIVASDGSYDSGVKRLQARIVEDLPLRDGAFNHFTLRITDAHGSSVPIDAENIQIAQGRYSVAGQMLPDDISLVVDDLSAKDTRLVALFNKNVVLPSLAKRTQEIGRTIVKGSQDEIRILVVEGPANRHSSTNKPLGMLLITGKQLTKDLLKGTEVDLKVSMSESRDLTVSAYLNGTDQEFSQVFTPTERSVSTAVLSSEVLKLEARIQQEIDEAEEAGQRDIVAGLNKTLNGVQGLMPEVAGLTEDDVTDKKYQLEDRKRELARDMHDLTAGKRLEQARKDYQEEKGEVANLVHESGNDRERNLLRDVINREPSFINSNNPEKIAAETAGLSQLRWAILMRTPDFLRGMFTHLADKQTSMNDQIQATQMLESGKRAIAREDWDEVRVIIGRLWTLVPAEAQSAEDMRMFTGLV